MRKRERSCTKDKLSQPKLYLVLGNAIKEWERAHLMTTTKSHILGVNKANSANLSTIKRPNYPFEGKEL
jgi:hypothetical protein